MKLVVDKVEYGYAPTGPGYGTKVFHIGFKEVEGDYELKDILDNENKVVEDATEEDKIANELIESIQNKVIEAKLEKEFSSSLINNFIYFSGDELIKDAKNTEVSATILKILEGTSFEFQKNIILRRNPNADLSKTKFNRLKTVYCCEPKYFTGNRKAYQIFEVVLCKLPLNSDYSETALVELEGYQNVFHIIELTDDFENEFKLFKEKYIDKNILSIPALKTFINVKADKKEVYDKLFNESDYIVARDIPCNSISI